MPGVRGGQVLGSRPPEEEDAKVLRGNAKLRARKESFSENLGVSSIVRGLMGNFERDRASSVEQ